MGKRKLYLYFLTQFQRCLLSSIPSGKITPNYNMLCTIANINYTQSRNNKQTLVKYLNTIGSKENLHFSHNLSSIDLDHPDFLKHKTITVVFHELKHPEKKGQADFFDDCLLMLQMPFTQKQYGNDRLKTKKDFEDGTFTEKFQLWLNSDRDIPEKVDVIKAAYKKNFRREITDAQVLKALQDTAYWRDIF